MSRKRRRSYPRRHRERNPFLLRFVMTVVTVGICAAAIGFIFSMIHAALLRTNAEDAGYPSQDLVALWSTFGLLVGLWVTYKRKFFKYSRISNYSDGIKGGRYSSK